MAESGSRRGEAGFTLLTVLKKMLGLSRRMAWYLHILPAVSHKFPFCSSRLNTWWGAYLVIGCPKKNFSASCKILQVAATALKQAGHPEEECDLVSLTSMRNVTKHLGEDSYGNALPLMNI